VIIPSMQPRRGKITPLMQDSSQAMREEYTRTLTDVLTRWMRPGFGVSAGWIEGDSAWVVVERMLNADIPAMLMGICYLRCAEY
jgi:hypothetical protein